MTYQDFANDYAAYTDQYGMVQPYDQGRMSGNGNLYTAQYVLAAHDNGFLTEELKEKVLQVYKNNEMKPGLLERYPGTKNNYNAHDDLLGAALASSLLDGGELARRILKYANENAPKTVDSNPDKTGRNKEIYYLALVLGLGKVRYNWNTANPETFHTSAWLHRRRSEMATLELVAHKSTSLVGYIALTISMVSVLFKDKSGTHDGFILPYIEARAIENTNFYTKFLSKLVRKKLRKEWSSFGKLLGAYFVNEKHPHVKWLGNSY